MEQAQFVKDVMLGTWQGLVGDALCVLSVVLFLMWQSRLPPLNSWRPCLSDAEETAIKSADCFLLGGIVAVVIAAVLWIWSGGVVYPST